MVPALISFGSDNWAGASDKVMALLGEANVGPAPAYGNDVWTDRAKAALNALFEREVTVFFVATGSGANSLAIAAYSRPGGITLCHRDSHIARDEAGAPLQFAPQLIDGLDGAAGRIDPAILEERLASYRRGNLNDGRPTVVSLTNVNEFGQCYSAAQVAELARLAKTRDCTVHMDGARFFNALAYLGASAADLTWRAGVDVLSLGLTKVGGWCAEMVVQFDGALAEDTAYRHKQAAMLLSKNRFASAQVCALLEEGHAMDLALHANRMAERLGETLAAAGAPPALAPQSNEVFAWLTPDRVARLKAASVTFAPWLDMRSDFGPTPPAGLADAVLHRFVASFRTTDEDIEAVAAALA
ncbi:threonine aldolase family protein [Acuticoccus sediminis]|nr:beta-eliminating lyase-related protein [Acuticoccus sediminis]